MDNRDDTRRRCPCGGRYVETGNVIDTCPPLIGHECDKCGTRTFFDEVRKYANTEKP